MKLKMRNMSWSCQGKMAGSVVEYVIGRGDHLIYRRPFSSWFLDSTIEYSASHINDIYNPDLLFDTGDYVGL
jgi:hypothetical protein